MGDRNGAERGRRVQSESEEGSGRRKGSRERKTGAKVNQERAAGVRKGAERGRRVHREEETDGSIER